MRVLVSLLLASIPISAGTVETVICDGVVYQGPASCGSQTTPGPYANVDSRDAWAEVWTAPGRGGGSSASASFTEEGVFMVTGGSGYAYAEPLLEAGGDSYFCAAWAGAWASFGGCTVSSQGGQYCPWSSVRFEFGVPQTLTLSLSAYANGMGLPAPPVGADAMFRGFDFFEAYGQPLGYNVNYTFVATPEPGTLPLLTAMACAALIAFDRRRKKR
jgi:hypothetical protein